mmetsp:Transcript_30424/g.81088  ORF Transcript_30424/g.81088 Transcript_30424/m.81088 type:complete len:121 (+) Transcript_30424:2-364(+)
MRTTDTERPLARRESRQLQQQAPNRHENLVCIHPSTSSTHNLEPDILHPTWELFNKPAQNGRTKSLMFITKSQWFKPHCTRCTRAPLACRAVQNGFTLKKMSSNGCNPIISILALNTYQS